MKKLLQGAVIGCALLATPVFAEEAAGVEYSANIGMVSKYIWRGWNLNDDLSAQGGFDVSFNGFSAGTWGGTDKNLGTEYDLYVGYGKTINDWVGFDVGFVQYRYPEKGEEVAEWHATVDFNFVSATYHRGEDGYYYYEVNAPFALTEKVTVEFHYGYEKTDFWDRHDYQVKMNYEINDNYSIFIAGSEKEKGDSNIFAGLMATF
jgi:uncharacterized protein (TIGR02001 family)